MRGVVAGPARRRGCGANSGGEGGDHSDVYARATASGPSVGPYSPWYSPDSGPTLALAAARHSAADAVRVVALDEAPQAFGGLLAEDRAVEALGLDAQALLERAAEAA